MTFKHKKYQPETLAVRSGTTRSNENEHSEALYLTSSYLFDDAADAADHFIGSQTGNIYSRFTNPTVRMMEERLAIMESSINYQSEQEIGCLAFSSGMAAINALCFGLLKSGDHIVASQEMFGSTVQLFNHWQRFGINVTYAASDDLNAWEQATQKPNTVFLYLETPSNPLTKIADIEKIAQIAHQHNTLLVVDNCFCTPALQKPLSLGADVVIHSATKYLDGQGRVLGGAVVAEKSWLKQFILPVLRMSGPTLSPFNAWVIHKGLETLSLRMKQQSDNAFALATWLEKQSWVKKVYYPFLPSHQQYELAKKQQTAGGAIVSFELETKEMAWQLIDATELVSITANLGDTRTTITHPATTTHGRLTAEMRTQAGISDGLIRLAVGLESVQDLQSDLQLFLNQK